LGLSSYRKLILYSCEVEKMRSMKISIIIPTLGRDTLSEVLTAILTESSVDFEVLVVFDGVDPGINPGRDDRRVQLLRTDEKAYAGGARNLGLEKATGDIVVFIGDDTIPTPGWLKKIHDWHMTHPKTEDALLGRVAWADHLASDSFHQWLERGPQFDYARLDRGLRPSWRHFYTSNISVKRALIAEDRFAADFQGWGFEDIEFGYRLSKKGMQLHFAPGPVVHHDDPQTLAELIKRTAEARKNAKILERLHPEVKLLPRGLKRLVLQCLVLGTWFVGFVPKVAWWREWKKSWIG